MQRIIVSVHSRAERSPGKDEPRWWSRSDRLAETCPKENKKKRKIGIITPTSFTTSHPTSIITEMSKLGLGENIDLHIMQLPVAYQKAKDLICKIWGTLQPLVCHFHFLLFTLVGAKNQLTVHIGLASSSKAIIILEQCGKNKGYKEMDVCGFCPEDGCCLLDGPEKIESTINMKTLWKNISVEGIDVVYSRDAGR
ncbi:hypothetical protein KIL84_014707 [Mauremys mutica]|uniref:Uncharacterized protein n=1 Tax=Mauremys mutica TaxID=74926 RepID=A0A9D3XQ69_9SAUR|nr:hypothetical protein KIL84_014707 [Mauremys mutica]